MKFTKESEADLRLPEGKNDHFVPDPDLPNFGIRLRRQRGGGTSKTWEVLHRVNGRQRRKSLGDTRRIDLEDARKIARQRFAQVELGIDPDAVRAEARARAIATRLTVAVGVERYLDAKRDVLRPSTYQAAKRYFTVHWKPLRDRPLDSVKRADVAARLPEIIKAHGRTSAKCARGYLRALFAWLMREGLCESNPVIATNDPGEGIQPRERVLSDGEIFAIWQACKDDDFGRIVRLLLLSGCRREEIAGLVWSEINLDTGVMTIPGTRTKNHRTLELTLPALALDILQSAPRRAGRDYVFGSNGRGGFSGFSYSTLALNSRIVEASKPVAPWRLHDLRRTMRTGLGKLGIAPHIAELCINHVKGGVEAIYDRHRYQREIKAALELWADHVAAIIEGRESNVVTLRQA